MAKTILITGVVWFIGSFLSRKLLINGYNVVGIDNFDGYYERKAKDFNLDLVKNYVG